MSVYAKEKKSVGDQLTFDGQTIPHEEVVKGKTPPPLPAEVEKPVTDQDVLDRVADLLEEFGWCQKSFAKREDGQAVFPMSSQAVKFCTVGAMGRAGRELGGKRVDEILTDQQMAKLMGWTDHPSTTREAVVLALRAGLPNFRNN